MLSQEFVCPVLITVIHTCPRQNVSRAPLNFIYKKIYVANCVQMDSILNKLVGLVIIVLMNVRLVMDRLQWSVMGASLDTFYMEQCNLKSFFFNKIMYRCSRDCPPGTISDHNTNMCMECISPCAT